MLLSTSVPQQQQSSPPVGTNNASSSSSAVEITQRTEWLLSVANKLISEGGGRSQLTSQPSPPITHFNAVMTATTPTAASPHFSSPSPPPVMAYNYPHRSSTSAPLMMNAVPRTIATRSLPPFFFSPSSHNPSHPSPVAIMRGRRSVSSSSSSSSAIAPPASDVNSSVRETTEKDDNFHFNNAADEAKKEETMMTINDEAARFLQKWRDAAVSSSGVAASEFFGGGGSAFPSQSQPQTGTKTADDDERQRRRHHHNNHASTNHHHHHSKTKPQMCNKKLQVGAPFSQNDQSEHKTGDKNTRTEKDEQQQQQQQQAAAAATIDQQAKVIDSLVDALTQSKTYTAQIEAKLQTAEEELMMLRQGRRNQKDDNRDFQEEEEEEERREEDARNDALALLTAAEEKEHQLTLYFNEIICDLEQRLIDEGVARKAAMGQIETLEEQLREALRTLERSRLRNAADEEEEWALRKRRWEREREEASEMMVKRAVSDALRESESKANEHLTNITNTFRQQLSQEREKVLMLMRSLELRMDEVTRSMLTATAMATATTITAPTSPSSAHRVARALSDEYNNLSTVQQQNKHQQDEYTRAMSIIKEPSQHHQQYFASPSSLTSSLPSASSPSFASVWAARWAAVEETLATRQLGLWREWEEKEATRRRTSEEKKEEEKDATSRTTMVVDASSGGVHVHSGNDAHLLKALLRETLASLQHHKEQYEHVIEKETRERCAVIEATELVERRLLLEAYCRETEKRHLMAGVGTVSRNGNTNNNSAVENRSSCSSSSSALRYLKSRGTQCDDPLWLLLGHNHRDRHNDASHRFSTVTGNEEEDDTIDADGNFAMNTAPLPPTSTQGNSSNNIAKSLLASFMTTTTDGSSPSPPSLLVPPPLPPPATTTPQTTAKQVRFVDGASVGTTKTMMKSSVGTHDIRKEEEEEEESGSSNNIVVKSILKELLSPQSLASSFSSHVAPSSHHHQHPYGPPQQQHHYDRLQQQKQTAAIGCLSTVQRVALEEMLMLCDEALAE